MKLTARMVIFGSLFTIVFFTIRYFDIIPMHVLLAETNGIGLLYSTIGLVFGVISAFIIQTQWENWNNLTISLHGEIKSLRHLLLFSSHVSPKVNKIIKKHIISYLNQIIEDWHIDDKEKSTAETISPIQKLQETVYSSLNQNPLVIESANQIIIRIIEYHDDVLHYSSRRLPMLIQILIFFSMTLVIVLPLFIGVKTLWLDYIITLSIALLAFLIYSVINELDNPLMSENWHISSKDYQKLLQNLV
ncbi:hypothetical protein M1615_00635 [Patescibacteria group bacterium]|nr:hypothetical protein [Patescibacteria group bacterium]MCL5010211.1 hypothetical protein [Patescibacteria group bacterium]